MHFNNIFLFVRKFFSVHIIKQFINKSCKFTKSFILAWSSSFHRIRQSPWNHCRPHPVHQEYHLAPHLNIGVKYFPKDNFPSERFPSGNFPNVQFPKRQHPRGQIRPSEKPKVTIRAQRCGQDGKEDRALRLEHARAPSTADRTDLGRCRWEITQL